MKKIWLTLWIYSCLTPLTGSAQASNRPNIILIVTDDQRWDALGIAGNSIIQTPNMDHLAREGVYFKNAFVTTPICAASRASLFTGLYERTHNYTFRKPPLKKEFIDHSYPKLLQDTGYMTGFFGKLGVNFENGLDTTIFDDQYVTGTQGYFRLVGDGARDHVHLTDHTTNKALDFIDEVPDGQPFCLSISYNAPHADDASPRQYFWPKRHDDLYENTVIPPPPLADDKYLKALPEQLQSENYMGRIRWKWRFDTPEKYQEKVKGYYRMITTIDDNLGRIRDKLTAKNLDQNTIIILIGDNGYFLGERQLAGKWLMYENSIRVPLIVYDPRANESNTINEMVLNIDVAPTILDLAGADIPTTIQGESLLKLSQNQEVGWRSEFLCEHLFDLPNIPMSEGMRTEKWKYFRYNDYQENEELYDLLTDPLEINNLVGDPGHMELLMKLRKKVDAKIGELESW